MMNFKNFLNKSVVQCEAAEPWQLGFQDPATPIMEGIVNLHHDIMFVIVVIGVFVGCTYTDPNTKQLTFNNMWPTGTVAADAKAYVIDDPDVVYMAQADGSVTQADLGQNTAFAATQTTSTGVLSNGNSTSAVESTTAATATLPFRIVDFVDSPTSTVGDAFTDVLIKFNAEIHSYNNPLGV